MDFPTPNGGKFSTPLAPCLVALLCLWGCDPLQRNNETRIGSWPPKSHIGRLQRTKESMQRKKHSTFYNILYVYTLLETVNLIQKERPRLWVQTYKNITSRKMTNNEKHVTHINNGNQNRELPFRDTVWLSNETYAPNMLTFPPAHHLDRMMNPVLKYHKSWVDHFYSEAQTSKKHQTILRSDQTIRMFDVLMAILQP